jgi:hypothetical protein
MFNKDGRTILRQLGAEWDRIVAGRSVALVLGDSLGDASMADGLGLDLICKVGFLNEPPGSKREALMAEYANAFDAVVLGDGPMDFVLELLGA